MANPFTNDFVDFLFPGQATRRQAVEQQPELAEIAAGPGHASVAEQRRQFEAQQAIVRDAQGAWTSILNQEMGGPFEGPPNPQALQRAITRYGTHPAFIALGQTGRSHMEVLQSLIARPTTGEAFTFGPGQERLVPDASVTEETVLPDGRRVPRGFRHIQGPPPSTTPRPFESSIDRQRSEMLQSIVTSGQQAQTALQELTALADPLLRTGQLFPQGTWQGYAASIGLPVRGRSDLQIVQSILDGLTPLQRRGLPGAASDRDMATFRGRLPDLMRTAEGNREILTFLLAQARVQATAGEVASRAFTQRDADPAEVFSRVNGVRFSDALAATRTEIDERRTAILEGATGIDVREIARMTDQQLRAFTINMRRRFPQGIPPSISRRIMSRADEISRSVDNP